MKRYICVHGHFYQPPRENPWTDEIEPQPSALPYRDWNERITAECYMPNTSARILDQKEKIRLLYNNYAHMSFNIGPTLLRWLARNKPTTYQAIREADHISRELFDGHGSAMAQAYNHMIMPLANRQDRWTQVRWGIEEFRHHFGRAPEGMWLPETAVDLETLDILAEQGILFTLLAPRQARRVRTLGTSLWRTLSDKGIDSTQPYLAKLPSGRTIHLFFYDGPTSQAVAFERLLQRGDEFAKRLESRFSPNRQEPQLVHIATDGESYGHHHPYGEMALAYALYTLQDTQSSRLTNYGAFLAKFPPTEEVEIFENSSWSCAHGVERWRSDCGCQGGRGKNWKQHWRAPLRDALDALRDACAKLYLAQTQPLFAKPWTVRDDYISVMLDPSETQIQSFLKRHGHPTLSTEQRTRLLTVLEMQRHAMLMYTSCGWFFDEVSDIETVQILRYAARAIQLSRDILGVELERDFLKSLENVPSNRPEYGNARNIYEQLVRTSIRSPQDQLWMDLCVRLRRPEDRIHETYTMSFRPQNIENHQMGRWRLLTGIVEVFERNIARTQVYEVAAFDTGSWQPIGGCRTMKEGQPPFDLEALMRHFWRGENHDIKSLFEATFPTLLTSKNLGTGWEHVRLKKTLSQLQKQRDLDALEAFELYVPVLQSLEQKERWPKSLQGWLHDVFEARWRQFFEKKSPRKEELRSLAEEMAHLEVKFDFDNLKTSFESFLMGHLQRWKEAPEELDPIVYFDISLALAKTHTIDYSLRPLQDSFYHTWRRHLPEQASKAKQGDAQAKRWLEETTRIAELLGFKVPISPAANLSK